MKQEEVILSDTELPKNNDENTVERTTPLSLLLTNWFEIIKLVVKKNTQDNLSHVSAGVAFYFLLAIFPLLGSLVSLYGLMVGQESLNSQMALLIGVIPEQARYILEERIAAIIETSDRALSTGFITGLLLSVWSAGKGAGALIVGSNITYEERNNRSFFIGMVTRVIFTLCILVFILVLLTLAVVIPVVLTFIIDSSINEVLIIIASWFVFTLMLIAGLSLMYRYAPHRRSARWIWITPGAIIACVMLLLVSSGFNYYVTEFASYNKTYGSIGGVIVMLMWFYLAAYVILIGAAINAAFELQTETDTTVGKDKPMGARGAYVADNQITKK